MPFEYMNKVKTGTPIFFIPGITGDAQDFLHIVKELSKTHPNRPLHVWWDERHPSLPDNQSEDAEISSQLAITKKASSIKDEIKKICPTGPYYIVGYSFGASLASIVAEHLDNVSLFIIDAPSIPLSKKYLTALNTNSTKDLIAIINHIATLSKLATVTFDEKEIEEISKKPPLSQLEMIYPRVLNNDKKENYKVGNVVPFLFFYNVVRGNLLNLMNHQASFLKPIENLAILTTKETRTKYRCHEDAGWIVSCNQLEEYPLDENDITHLSLLTKDAGKVANLIKSYFNKIELTIQSVKTSSSIAYTHGVTTPNTSPGNSPPLSPLTQPVRTPSPPIMRSQDDCKMPSPPSSPLSDDHGLVNRLSELQVQLFIKKPKLDVIKFKSSLFQNTKAYANAATERKKQGMAYK